jgi:adenylate cyclase
LIIVSIWIFTGALTAIYEFLFLANFNGVTETVPMQNYSFTGSLITAMVWAFLGGIMFAGFELFYFQERLIRKSFLQIVGTKMIIYSIMLIGLSVFASFFYNSITLSAPFWDAMVIQRVITFISGVSFWHPLLPFIALVLLTLFIIQINNKFGRGELWKFIRGEYFHPKEEVRIFMFLDLNSSTTIAEKLGHVKFFNLLNDFFQDITNDIIMHNGEIVDYVGDEIIISWNLEEGLEKEYCIKCFYAIEERMEGLSSKYERKYDLKPTFKAGMHCGIATIGEIGKIKKEIVFSGDVMNTTSRIQSLCNEKGYQLVISNDLRSLLPKSKYPIIELGEILLKGKISSTKIFGINPA